MIDNKAIDEFKNLISTFSLEGLEKEKDKLTSRLNQMMFDPNLCIEITLVEQLIEKRKGENGKA